MVGDNFSYKGSKPLDARTKFATVAEMVATPVADLYDGCEAYVTATKKYYSYDSTNEVDETLGKWRERQSGGSGTTDYSDLNNKPQIEGITLSGNKTASDLGLAKTTDLANFITKTVDDLVNYYTKSQTYSKTEVDTIVTAIKNSRFEVVATLPTSDIKTNVIYLVPKADAESGDIKDEYINLDGTTAGWEKIGSTEVDLSGYVTSDDLNTALADYTTTTDLTALLANKQDKLQYSTLPTASAELEGKIFEYTGATGGGLTHGYFYECVSDGENPATYSWQQTNVQPSSGGGGSYTAGEGIEITNDVISTKQSEEGDIDEIIDVYPQAGNLVSIVNAFNKGDIYSTEEKMIGQWIDGKPLYQKTIVKNNFEIRQNASFAHGISNVDHIFIKEGHLTDDTGSVIVPLIWSDTYDGVYINATNVGFKGTGVWGAQTTRTIYLTVRYTKNTDTAISIGEETEYSTDEKVVGTWIDGKPIYQCTFEVNNPSTDWSEIILANKSVSYAHKVSAEFYRGGIFTEFFNSTSDFVSCAVFAGSNLTCRIKQAGNSGITKAIFTTQYTKTTT